MTSQAAYIPIASYGVFRRKNITEIYTISDSVYPDSVDPNNKDMNGLIVLDKNLKIIKKIKQISPTALSPIEFSKFSNNSGYFGFHSSDESSYGSLLLPVEFSKNGKPKLLKFSKLDGEFTELCEYGEDLLCGIKCGIKTFGQYKQTNKYLVMLDASKRKEIVEINKLQIDGDCENLSSFNSKGTVGLTLDGEGPNKYMLFEYDKEKGFINKLSYTIDSNVDEVKSFYVDDTFYIITSDKITSFDSTNNYSEINHTIIG